MPALWERSLWTPCQTCFLVEKWDEMGVFLSGVNMRFTMVYPTSPWYMMIYDNMGLTYLYIIHIILWNWECRSKLQLRKKKRWMPGGFDPISDSCRLRQRLATMARDVVVNLRSTRLYLRSGSRSHGCLVSLLEGGDWNMENPLKMMIFPLKMVIFHSYMG